MVELGVVRWDEVWYSIKKRGEKEMSDKFIGHIIQGERGYGMSMCHINKNKIKFIKTFKKE